MADFSINAELKANASQFVSELKKGETSVGNFGSIVEKVLGSKGKLVMALAAATAAAVKFGQAMNSSMSEIAKGTGKTGEELYKLRENVHDSLVGGVARSAKEVGVMIADLNTRFGVTGDEVVALTKDFDKFSKVTGVETKTAINLTADAMKKWNIDVADTDKLLDQLTVASQESGAGVDELLNGLKSGQAVFSQFGMSATDTIAFMSSLKSNGIETSQALVAMRTALAKFAKEGINAEEGFAEVSEAIKNAKTQTEALNIATNIFGTKNGAEMVKVLQSGANSADDLKKKLEEAGGAVERTNAAARTSQDAFKELTSALSGTFGGIAEGFDQLFKGVFDVISRVVKMLDPLLRPIMNVIRDVLGFVGDLAREIANLVGDVVENGLGFNLIGALLQSAYETIHHILDNILESFKTCFNLISHIMTGQWNLVLLDVEKLFLTFAKTILDYVSDLLNGFKDQINVFIEKVINPFIEKVNWVEEKLGKKKTDKVDLIENFNLSDTTGLDAKLAEITSKIEKASKKSKDRITGDLGEVKKTAGTTADDIIEDSQEVSKATLQVMKNLKKGIKNAVANIGVDYATLEDKTEQLNKLFENMGAILTNTVATAFKSFFTELGKELVDGGLSWKNMTAIVLESIAETLSALGSELVALAAVRAAERDFGTAALAAAGAAAAFTASGAINAVASKMKETAEESSKVVSNLSTLQEKLKEIKQNASFETLYSDISELSELLGVANDKLLFADIQYNIAKNLESIGLGSSKDELKALNKAQTAVDKLTTEINDYYETALKNIKAVGSELDNQIDYYKGLASAFDDIVKAKSEFWTALSESLGDGSIIYSDMISLSSGMYKYQIMLKEQLNSIKQATLDVYIDLTNIGNTFGEKITDGIIDGITSSDFTSQIKEYMRENLIKLAVYTDEFSERLAESSTKLVMGITTKNADILKETKEELEDLWNTAIESAKEAENILSDIFGEVETSISDVGTNIAESLVSGLTDGLSEADFMETMKNYIKGMVVNAVVYTEALQAEIKAIGEAISNGISEGFTDTGLHEIRRDLSYIFNQANNAVGSVDEILSSVFSGYATGTNSATAGLHLVGEAGPELVRFKGGEQVYNANDTKNMLNSGAVGGNNFNITFNNMQDTSAFAMMQQLKAYQRELAINGVI